MLSRRAVRLAMVLAVFLASLGIAAGASAAGVTGTVKLDPATSQIDNGGTVSIKVIATTTVATSGVSATITFDKSVLQVTSITRSSAWANAPLFLAADASAIAAANKKGVLKGVTAGVFPPASVPAGAQEFITVGFKAIACGSVNLGLPIGTTNTDTQVVDGRTATYGALAKLTTTGATVTVCQGGAGASPPAGASASASDGASADPGASDSFDPNASAVSGDTSQPSASAAPTGPLPSAGAFAPADTGSPTNEQSGWLTFAMAALAVAAAGLAALILVLTIVAIVAAVAGGTVLIRAWRRYSDTDGKPSEGAPAPAAAPDSPSAAEGSTAQDEAPAGDAAGTATPPPADQP